MAVTRDDVEKTVWRLTGWKVDQRTIDDLMAVVDEYAASGPSHKQTLWLTPPEEAARQQELKAQVDQAYAEGFEQGRQAARKRTPAPPKPKKKAAPKAPKVATTDQDRECRACTHKKPIVEFRSDPHGPGLRRIECKDCENDKRRTRNRNKRAGRE